MKPRLIFSFVMWMMAFGVSAEAAAKSAREATQDAIAECPFSLGNLCFYPAVGAMYGNKKGGEKYKDLRFAAVIHEEISDNNKHSLGAMIAPGENFIDAAGFGGAFGAIKVSVDDNGNSRYAVLNYGLMAKRHKYEKESDDIRGGVYLLLSYNF